MLRTANTFYSHSDLSTCALDKRVKQLPLQGSSSKGLFLTGRRASGMLSAAERLKQIIDRDYIMTLFTSLRGVKRAGRSASSQANSARQTGFFPVSFSDNFKEGNPFSG